MKVASVANVKSKLSAYLQASREGPVVVTRNGKAVAVLLAVEDDDELERLLMAYTPRLRAILDAARGRIQRGAGIPHEDFWQDILAEDESKAAKRRDRPRRKAAPTRQSSETAPLQSVTSPRGRRVLPRTKTNEAS